MVNKNPIWVRDKMQQCFNATFSNNCTYKESAEFKGYSVPLDDLEGDIAEFKETHPTAKDIIVEIDLDERDKDHWHIILWSLRMERPDETQRRVEREAALEELNKKEKETKEYQQYLALKKKYEK